jgi:hypothetical protein
MIFDRKIESLINMYRCKDQITEAESIIPQQIHNMFKGGISNTIFNTKFSVLFKNLNLNIEVPPENDLTWNELSNFDSWTDLPAWVYNTIAVFEPTGILSWPAFVEAINEYDKEQGAWNTIFLILAAISIIPVGGKPAKLVWGMLKLLMAPIKLMTKFVPGGRMLVKMTDNVTGWFRSKPKVVENISFSSVKPLDKISTSSGKKASEVYINFLRTNRLLPESEIVKLEKLIKNAEAPISKQAEKAALAVDDAAKIKAAKQAKVLDDAAKIKAAKEAKAAAKIVKPSRFGKELLPAVVGGARMANSIKEPLDAEIERNAATGQSLIDTLKKLGAASKNKPILQRRPGFASGKIGDIRPGGSF